MPIMLVDPTGECPTTLKNIQDDFIEGRGSFALARFHESDADADADPDPQQPGQPGGCGWNGSGGGGGGAYLDGGFLDSDLLGIFTASGSAVVCPNGNCNPTTKDSSGQVWSMWFGANGPSWNTQFNEIRGDPDAWLPYLPDGYLSLSFNDPGYPGGGGWEDNPNNLILKVIRDCFNRNQGRRETTYQLETTSGDPVQGQYTIWEQLSNTSLAPPWGQSPQSSGNQFEDTLRPGLGSSGTLGFTQYFLVTPNTLNNAKWIPIDRSGSISKFNSISMTGAGIQPANNLISVNGSLAPDCP
jgi:hypothetical protein